MRIKLSSPFEWGIKCSALWVASALLLLSAWQLPAQTTIATNSFASLQNAVAAGGTYLLSFNGVVSATNSLLVTKNLTLYTTATNTVTISGNNSNRLFQVSSNVTLTISNLTLSGGNNIGTNGAAGATGTSSAGGSQGNSGGSGGGGVNGFGGAIYNQGTTLAYFCIFLTNSATGGAGGAGGAGGNGSITGGNGGSGGNGGTGLGGAIYNLGTLLASNCTFAGNGAVAGSGGIGGTNGVGQDGNPGAGGLGGIAAGAGLYNLGTATIVGCAFEFNFSQAGNSQAAGPPRSNQDGSPGPSGAFAEGGGIYNLGSNTIINCTFNQNLAVGGNGGNGGNTGNGGSDGGNGGNGGNGFGGNLFNDTAGHVSVTNCTFAGGESFGGTNGIGGTGSFAAGNPGSPGSGYGANVANFGTFNLKNSILAYPTNAANAYGTITDQGYNLSSDGTPTLATNSHNNLDPLLQPLTNNGGPTLTMALTPGSPAIDAIFDNSAPTIDQRGFSRTSNSGLRSDIGAYEYNTNATITYYSVSGHISLGSNGLANVTVQASGTNAFNSTNLYSAQTGSAGDYQLANLPGGTYVITPQPSGSFTPVNAKVSLPISTNVDFVRLPNSSIVFTLSNSLVNLFVTGIPNTTYRIQASSNLVGGWQNIGVKTAGSDGTFTFPTSTTGFTNRFYRAVTP